MQVRVLGFIHGQGRQSDKRGYYPLSINFRIFDARAVFATLSQYVAPNCENARGSHFKFRYGSIGLS